MNIYLISQDKNIGYDTFDSAVVVAKSAAAARKIHPSGNEDWDTSTWCLSPDKVHVEYIGKAQKGMEAGVICASFNAG